MAKRTRRRSSGPKLVAKKKKSGAAKRKARKYKATPVLKRAIRTEIAKTSDSQHRIMANRIGANLNGHIDNTDIITIWDEATSLNGAANANTYQIAQNTSPTGRIGDEVQLTTGYIYVCLRAFAPENLVGQYGKLDMWVVVYFFTPRQHKEVATYDWSARTVTADNFLKYNGVSEKFVGTHINGFLKSTNSDHVILHKKYMFRVQNEIGGRSSWFHNFKIPLKPKKLMFKENSVANTPTNYNPCIAIGYINVNEQENLPTVNATRLTASVYTKMYWKA